MLTGDRPGAPGHRRRDAPGLDRVRPHRRPEPPRTPGLAAYDLDRRATMRFDAECEVLDDPGRDDRLAFEAHRV